MPVLNNQVFNDQFANRNSVVNASVDLDERIGSQENTSSLNTLDNSQKTSAMPINSIMSELNRLSKSFADTYQNLEGQVEKLNGQLENETQQKNSVIQEKQQLLGEKAFLSDRLQSLLAIMPAGVVVIDGEGKVKDCNAKAVDFLGRPLLGELWITVIKRVFQPQADDGHQVSLKDGRKIHIETRALDVEPGQLVVLTDLTKSRALQAELTQQQKLSSMGKMIASLAHQIRTPLSAAILYGSHLGKGSLEKDIEKQFSEKLLERLHFMERQINDMLGFVRGERKQKSLLSPIKLFSQLKSMSLDFPDYVNFAFTEQDDQKLLLADQDALVGAIINLIENAIDACADKSRKSNSNPAFVEVNFNVSNSLTISVKDNGDGIDKVSLQKIFEPFHTTKKQGNGLGLAIVHGIVIEHSGRITAQSEKNMGSSFEINLPLISATNATTQSTTKSKAKKQSSKVKQEKTYEF